MIIDGKKEADNFSKLLAEKTSYLKDRHQAIPLLAIVLIGNNEASLIYVRNKINKAIEIGIQTKLINLSATVTEKEVIKIIIDLNFDNNVHGVIVQFPLPNHIDSLNIIEAIDPKKDVDGFHPINIGYLNLGLLNKGFVPATPLGCLHLIKLYLPDIQGLHAVVIGRSNIVGRPLSLLLLHHDCTVTICHSFSLNLKAITRSADIVVSCVGKPKIFNDDFFSQHATVIDVGVARINGKISGDVDFNLAASKVKNITPVPGGVGPMTVAYLIANTLKAFEGSFYKS